MTTLGEDRAVADSANTSAPSTAVIDITFRIASSFSEIELTLSRALLPFTTFYRPRCHLLQVHLGN